jgi:peptidoglycan-associated lipoprotein
MPQGASQVSSGNIAPTIKGPKKDTKEVIVLAGVVVFIGGLLAAVWVYSQAGDRGNAMGTTGKMENVQVSDLLKNAAAVNQPNVSFSTHVATPVVSIPDIIHADIYFEVGRKGLTDEGKAQLSAQADMLKQHEEYGVLIQGYTDQQGSASYNKLLGMKRAETVKAELLKAGIDDRRIKAVSLGEEGVLCVDSSDTCRHMNRRVHLEFRKIGQEHMVLPPVPATVSDPTESVIDPSSTTEDSGPTTDSTSSAPSAPTTTLEPASGS